MGVAKVSLSAASMAGAKWLPINEDDGGGVG